MKISFTEMTVPKKGTLAVNVFDGRTLSAFASRLDEELDGQLTRAMKNSRFKGKKEQWLDILAPSNSPLGRIVLYGVGEVGKLDELSLEAVGGTFVGRMNKAGETQATIVVDCPDGAPLAPSAAAAHVAYGAMLGSYEFTRYHTQREEDSGASMVRLAVGSKQVAAARKTFAPLESAANGVFMTRDLVSEPANVLYPESFAAECRKLEEIGVKVEVLGEAAMKKLGMHALLAVGQGSERESRLVVMRWNGLPAKEKKKPVVFVGKGVCFDTGGISLKPAGGMEEMKWDMGGAGAVTGAMRALALRKAKANVVGVIALVENMPDGKAQRPGDVVKSLSGQTIEVLNTDAEGRLILADALWYAQEKYKPAAMIDLATLTGAIIISLGNQYAGLFSNNDEVAEQVFAAGKAEGEDVWRLPMHENYAKTLKSQIADMQNIASNGRGAGSIVAAEFLKKFVNDTPWAHIDIAGMAWSKKERPTVPRGATGFGVRLLDRYVRDHHEKT
jgi:leucyl aminopeptidase